MEICCLKMASRCRYVICKRQTWIINKFVVERFVAVPDGESEGQPKKKIEFVVALRMIQWRTTQYRLRVDGVSIENLARMIRQNYVNCISGPQYARLSNRDHIFLIRIQTIYLHMWNARRVDQTARLEQWATFCAAIHCAPIRKTDVSSAVSHSPALSSADERSNCIRRMNVKQIKWFSTFGHTD